MRSKTNKRIDTVITAVRLTQLGNDTEFEELWAEVRALRNELHRALTTPKTLILAPTHQMAEMVARGRGLVTPYQWVYVMDEYKLHGYDRDSHFYVYDPLRHPLNDRQRRTLEAARARFTLVWPVEESELAP